MDPIRENPILPLLETLPAFPFVASRSVARLQPGLEPGALERFDRSGYVLLPAHEPIFFGLLPNAMTGAAAECALREKLACAAKDRLKLDATTPIADGYFARLARVKGQKTVCVLVSHDKSALDGVVPTPTTAPAFELSLAAHVDMGGDSFDLPGVPRNARLNGTLAEENHATVLSLSTATP
jgi:hypothetical protein